MYRSNAFSTMCSSRMRSSRAYGYGVLGGSVLHLC